MMDLLATFSYNTTTFPPSNSTKFYSARIEQIISMAIYCITLLMGVTGNGIVIILTGFHMKKTVTTIWYLNLAMANFIFSISLSSEIVYLALDYHWTLGRLMCTLNGVLLFLSMYASVFFLTAISADRCISVICPVWALNHRTLRLASFMAACIWGAALALSLPGFIFYNTEHFPDGSIDCTFASGGDNNLHPQLHLSMVVTDFVVGFLAPFSIILACYCAIVIKLRGSLLGCFSRSFKVIVAVVLVFFCCWFPHHLFSILETLEDDSLGMEKAFNIGPLLGQYLVCLNSCLNPLLYTFMGKGYKATNGQSFLSSFKGAFSEKWVLRALSSSRNSSCALAVESTMF